MKSHARDRARRQKELRRRRGERAFLFDKELATCLGELDREDWEFAIQMAGGDVAAAARECGLADVPRGSIALWGRSRDEALGTYRRWQRRRKR